MSAALSSLLKAAEQPALLRPQPPSDVPARQRNTLIGVVVAAHVACLWGLLQVGVVQVAMRQVAPLRVDFISLQSPPPPEPLPPAPPPRQAATRAAPPPPMPVIAAAAAAAPSQTPQPLVVPPQPEAQPVVPVAPAPAEPPTPVPPAPAPSPPAPPQPRLLPASNIAYLVPPPIEVPLASRRLGEQGLVMLRVRVGVDGLPRQVSLQRSSGYARLDEQAMSAMKQARFEPQTDNGAPIEWIVVAPLQYEIE